MYEVYAIASIEKKYIYVGLTSDLDARLERHNNGYERTTKPYVPFLLVYREEQPNRVSARAREKYLKSRKGKRLLYKLMQESYTYLTQYAQ